LKIIKNITLLTSTRDSKINDPSTLYSNLVLLCGCQSVVIPSEGISENDWKPNYISYGVAYGFENIPKARDTIPLMREALLLAAAQSQELVRLFVKEVDEYFGAY